jgi:S1-C subfamily serine protease
MRKPALYSSANSPPRPAPGAAQAVADASPPSTASARHLLARLLARLTGQSTDFSGAATVLLALLLVLSLLVVLRPAPQRLTQKDINAAVLKTLATSNLPSPMARAYAAIRPSVVRVVSQTKTRHGKGGHDSAERSIGTGVVIMDKGVILTNLHVVQGTVNIKVTFADGSESSASIVNVQPENDLAVLQAATIPDDLQAATLRSTTGLRPGDQVMAVGYPFGIGPSASAGVISGIRRTLDASENEHPINNLIQFDAAANPGNSGGPLVTMDGEVVGIVTAIYNPSEQRTFIGIGFAVPVENAAAAAGLSPF